MADSTSSQNTYGIHITHRRTGMLADETAKELFYIAKSLGAKSCEISRIIINSEYGYARLEVYSKECEDLMVESMKQEITLKMTKIFGDFVAINRINMSDGMKHLEKLTDSEGKLDHKEGKENTEKQKKSIGIASAKPLVNDLTKCPRKTVPAKCARRTVSAMTLTFCEMSKEKPQKLHAAASTSEIPPHKQTDSTGSTAMLSAATSTPSIYQCSCPDTVFYRRRQIIGTESRYREFKTTGAIHNGNVFRYCIGTYVCGFLNSEGGTIYFGVDDNGAVIGLEIDKNFEDILRHDIIFSIGLITPTVHKSEYLVNFARVITQTELLPRNLKVLELCVKPRYPGIKRYYFDRMEFIRRDGTLQWVK